MRRVDDGMRADGAVRGVHGARRGLFPDWLFPCIVRLEASKYLSI